MINYTCSRGHEIAGCADCAWQDRHREEWAEWLERWAAAPDAEFALGSNGTIHRRDSCILTPKRTTLDPAWRDQHSPPLSWPLREEDAAILLVAERGRLCKLCCPNVPNAARQSAHSM